MSVYPAPSVQVDLLRLMSADTTLRRHVKNEWVGGCPLCGEGTDRFVVWPYDPHPRWWCRRCERKGDAITYIMERDHVGFKAACERLEGMPAMATPVRHEERGLTNYQREGLQWIADECHIEITCEDHQKPRAWLADRGIDGQACIDWWLGYALGMPGESSPWTVQGWDEPKPRHVSVAHGITIPLTGVDGVLYGLSVRRAVGKPKYLTVSGSQVPLFGKPCAHPGGTLVIVEGWLDAILLHRLAWHLVDVVALGSARADVDERWRGHLCQYSRWLICTDNDQAGEKAAAGWCAWSERASRLPVPAGHKDVTEYWQAVAAALAGHQGRPGADQMVTAWLEDAVRAGE